MRKFLSLIVVLMTMVASAQAQSYVWKEVKPSMTTVPEDFYPGVTAEEAKDHLFDDFMSEGAVYGNLPAEGEAFNVVAYDADWILEFTTRTWAEIASNGLYVYPAAVGGQTTALTHIESACCQPIQKQLRNGKLTINANGKIYNAIGVIVK